MYPTVLRILKLLDRSKPGLSGRFGDVTKMTLAPWVASVLPATGAAMARVISTTRKSCRHLLLCEFGMCLQAALANCSRSMGWSAIFLIASMSPTGRTIEMHRLLLFHRPLRLSRGQCRSELQSLLLHLHGLRHGIPRSPIESVHPDTTWQTRM